MAILVDTNVIIDVLTDDRLWADWSIGQLAAHEGSGLVINPVIFSELCFGFDAIDGVEEVVAQFGLIYSEIPRPGLFQAAKAFRIYKSRSGTKRSVLPDFFVGGHAEAAGMPVLTRDTSRFQTYFPTVRLIHPNE
jgi:hypothetical protein